MAGNVPFPCYFLVTPSEPSILFKTWWQIFENYLLVIGATGNSWPVTHPRAVLLHCFGTKGQHLFYSLSDTGTKKGDTAMRALLNDFVPKTKVVAEHRAFGKRGQMSNKTVMEQFVLDPNAATSRRSKNKKIPFIAQKVHPVEEKSVQRKLK